MSAGSAVLTRVLDDGRRAVVTVTDRTDGDLRVGAPGVELDGRRRQITQFPWTWLDQVHGSDVVVVDGPGRHAGAIGDAAVTAVSGAALAVHTADCAPVALIGAAGVVGVVHAGWRGLVAGVIPATVTAMRDRGAGAVSAYIGPCIHAGCYEFGESDLTAVARGLGVDSSLVSGITDDGRPALDLPGATAAALQSAGVDAVTVDERCTGCAADRFSHRVGGDVGRQALVAWIEP